MLFTQWIAFYHFGIFKVKLQKGRRKALISLIALIYLTKGAMVTFRAIENGEMVVENFFYFQYLTSGNIQKLINYSYQNQIQNEIKVHFPRTYHYIINIGGNFPRCERQWWPRWKAGPKLGRSVTGTRLTWHRSASGQRILSQTPPDWIDSDPTVFYWNEYNIDWLSMVKYKKNAKINEGIGGLGLTKTENIHKKRSWNDVKNWKSN